MLYNFKVVKLKCILEPEEYNESILQQANQMEVKTYLEKENAAQPGNKNSMVADIKITCIDSGLENLYFIFKSTSSKLAELNKHLAALSEASLVKLQREHLQINKFYLVKLVDGKFYRSLLLSANKLKLIDSGTIIDLNCNQEALLFILMPRFFKYNTFALHCRLTVANSIERVWTPQEKASFYSQIKLNSFYQIRVFNAHEPHIVEFYDQNKKINFDFNDIIKRFDSGFMERPTVMRGNRCQFALAECFHLGGNLLKKVSTKKEVHNLFGNVANASEEKFFIYSQSMLDELEEYSHQVDSFVAKQMSGDPEKVFFQFYQV